MENLITINGTGALRDPEDIRDYKAEELFGAVKVDWSKPTGIVPIKARNQGLSSSCTGQATSYYHDVLDPNPDDPYSARDIYSQIYLPQGGAYIRDAVLFPLKRGHARRSEVPEPQPQSEVSMRDRTGINPKDELDGKVFDAYVLPEKDIEYTAWAIQNFKGVVLGVELSSEGWQNPEFPRPPLPGEKYEGHCLYGADLAMINGKKYIKCASSWNETQQYHYLGEDYFLSGFVFNPWVIIPKKNMRKYYKVNDNGTLGILVREELTGSLMMAKDLDTYNALISGFEVPDNAPIINLN